MSRKSKTLMKFIFALLAIIFFISYFNVENDDYSPIENKSIKFLEAWNLQIHYQSIQEMNISLQKKFGESDDGYAQRIINTANLFSEHNTRADQIVTVTNNIITGFSSRSFTIQNYWRIFEERIINHFFGGNYIDPSQYEFAKENSKILALIHTTQVGYLDANEKTYKRYEEVYEPFLGENFEGYKERTLKMAQFLLKQ